MSNSTRRKFLQQTAAIGVASTVPAGSLLAAGKREQIKLGIIGCGWRGGQLLDVFQKLPGVEIAGLCDPDQDLLVKTGEKAPKAHKWIDMRDLIESSDIDAVAIATCNHWHCLAAIWAMEAGKHVYVEKPLSHTQWEGEQVINASVKYGRVCQVGTQQRSDPMQAEIQKLLHDDKVLGEINSVRVNRFGERKSIGKRSTPLVPPKSVDYNLWLGPAEDLSIYRDKLHYDWHWDWNTGSGEMGNWGVHIIDDVRNNIFRDSVPVPNSVTSAGGRFAWNDAGNTPNVHVAVLDAGGIPVIVSLSNLPVDKASVKVPGPGSGYIAYCEGGRLEGQRGKAAAFDSDGKLIKSFAGSGGMVLHQQNFIDAIRNNRPSQLIAPAQVGHDSTMWCNLINIAARMPADANSATVKNSAQLFGSETQGEVSEQLQRILSANGVSNSESQLQFGPTLHYDNGANRFAEPNTEAANRLLRRKDRKPFVVPEVKV